MKKGIVLLSGLRRRFFRKEPQSQIFAAVAYAVAAVTIFVIFFSVYGLWGKNLRTPIVAPVGDYNSHALFAKTAMETGWCGVNPRLGAPFRFECYDFPMADGLNFAFFAVFGRFSDDVTLGMNLHYFLGYLLIGLTSLFVFRQFGFPTLPSLSASVLYAFLPYHYLRAEYHLFLSAYYLLPLMILVIAWIYTGDPLFERTSGTRLRFRPTRKGVAALVICILMGSGGVYYAAFALIFLFVTAILVLSRTKRPASLLAPVLAGTLILAAVLVNLSPNLWFFHVYGQDQDVAHRQAPEAEQYGLKIANLLLPIPNHRLASFARARASYSAFATSAGENVEELGMIAGLGFLILIVSLFWTDSRDSPSILTLFNRLNLAAVLAATVGGFGSLFNIFVSAEIRVYARISIYIAFFSLGALLLVLKRLRSSFAMTPRTSLLFNMAAAGIIFLGLWDITPNVDILRTGASSTFKSNRDFVRRIEALLPGNAMIFQLPYMSFPEHGPLNQMVDYDPARGYLYSNHLRWSYGTTNGRPSADWQQHEASLSPGDLLPSLKLIGFAGIWIDTFGYADRAAALSSQIGDLLRIEPLRSPDGRLLFFPITGYEPPGASSATPEERKRLRETAVALPPQVSFAHCSGLERQGDVNWHWCERNGEIWILNPNPETAIYELNMVLRTAYPQFSNFHFRGDLGSGEIRANANGTPVASKLSLSPGLHALRIESDAPRVVASGDPRDMHFEIVNFQLTER